MSQCHLRHYIVTRTLLTAYQLSENMGNNRLLQNAGFVIMATILCQELTQAKLTLIPKDTEAKVGDTTFINCSTDLASREVHWNHGNNYVYAGGSFLEPYLGRFLIDKNQSTGAYNLVIPAVEARDAGEYSCVDDGGLGVSTVAQLIVLESDPICESNLNSNEVVGPNSCGVEPDELQLSCGSQYFGNIPPQMEWKKSEEAASIVARTEIAKLLNGNKVISTFTAKASVSMDGHSHICQTTRSTTNQYTCSSRVYSVLHASGNDTVVERLVDDEINCSAHSNLFCNYKWKLLSSGVLLTVSNNTILKPEQEGTYRCEAECQLRNSSCTVVAMVVKVSSTSHGSGTALWWVGLVVLMVVLLLAVVLIVLIIIRRQKRRMYGQKAVTDTAEDDYLASPRLVKIIRTKSATKQKTGISGLAVANDQLFITHFKTSSVEVYNLKTLKLERNWMQKQLVNAFDLAYCDISKCLYIMDVRYSNTAKEIMRVDTYGKIINLLSTGNGYGCLSVAFDSNVVFASSNEHFVAEYSPAGHRILQIDFSSKPEFAPPLHVIKISSEQLLVSFGNEDSVHRVCKINRNGDLLQSFGENSSSTHDRLSLPIYLALVPNGKILAIDRDNMRIILLTSELEFEGEQIPRGRDGLSRPERMALDVSRGYLLVASNDESWKECEIFVFRTLPSLTSFTEPLETNLLNII